MALINCECCGKEISEDAKMCPNCGNPVIAKKYCSNCGTQYKVNEQRCPNCGTSNSEVSRYSSSDSDKTLVGVMAILLGGIGVHYFILGKVGAGFLCILLTLVSCSIFPIVTLIQGIMILAMSEEEYQRKYVNSTSFFPF